MGSVVPATGTHFGAESALEKDELTRSGLLLVGLDTAQIKSNYDSISADRMLDRFAAFYHVLCNLLFRHFTRF